MNGNPFWKIICSILLFLFIGLSVYNIYVGDKIKYETGGDAAEFIELGVSLSKNGQFSFLEIKDGDIIQLFEEKGIAKNDFLFAGHNTWRPPIWPILIAGIFLVFGYNLMYLLLFKFVLHSIGTFIFYKILKIYKFNYKIILAGIALYAFNPVSQLYSRTFLSEPITFFIITLWLYFLIKFLNNKAGLVPHSIIAGLLILSHPYFIFLPFITFMFLYINKLFKLKLLIFSTLITLSVLSIWVVRNFIVLNTNEVILTTSSGSALAIGWNKNVAKAHTNTKGDLLSGDSVLEYLDYNKKDLEDEITRSQIFRDASINFIRRNPDLILPIIVKKLKSAFNPLPETPKPGFLETGRALYHIFALIAILYILLFTNNRFPQSLALTIIFSTIAITILTYSGFRFRMPQLTIEIFLIIYMVQDIFKKINQRTIRNKLQLNQKTNH